MFAQNTCCVAQPVFAIVLMAKESYCLRIEVGLAKKVTIINIFTGKERGEKVEKKIYTYIYTSMISSKSALNLRSIM